VQGVEIPSDLSEWFHSVLAGTPPSCHPPSANLVLQALADNGAVHGSDFHGAALDELRGIWPPLAGLSDEFLRAMMWHASRCRSSASTCTCACACPCRQRR
jgi:hypothetical protein